MTATQPKVALVYDWLDTQFGGAEFVLQTLIAAFPQATLYTAKFYPALNWAQGLTVRSSLIDRLPLIKRWRSLTALCSPIAFEALDLSEFDLIISITSFAAKAVLTKPHQCHLCYVLSPPRFVYRLDSSYLPTDTPLRNWLIRLFSQPFLNYLKRFDQVATYRPDVLIPISQRVRRQIGYTSDRQTTDVLYPPVKLQDNAPIPALRQVLPANYLLSVGRLVQYKKVDLAMQAALATGKQLLIVGDGPDRLRLVKLADNTAKTRRQGESLVQFLIRSDKAPILFLLNCDPTELATLYQSAQALLALGEDDFGLTPLEAASVGTISILNQNSGVAEVLTQQLAIHVDATQLNYVMVAIDKLQKTQISPAKLKNTAQKFTPSRFISYWQSWREHATNV